MRDCIAPAQLGSVRDARPYTPSTRVAQAADPSRGLSWAGPEQPLAVPFAVALGVPLYANVAGVLPLIEALHAKGLALGTLIAFMMAVVALSLPETILLRRVLKPRLIALFIAVVAGGILLLGLGLNLLAPIILEYGVQAMPALLLDGEVIVSGRVPSPRQLADLLR